MIGVGVGLAFQPPKKDVIVRDSFDRADNPSVVGNADTGQVWQSIAGTWGINSNSLYLSGNTSGKTALVCDAMVPDFDVSTKVSVFFNSSRLVVRFEDIDNHLFFQGVTLRYELGKYVDGSATILGSYSQSPVNGDIMRVVCRGSQITAYVNGVQVIAVTDSFNDNASKAGLGSNNNGAGNIRYDDFLLRMAKGS